MKPTKTSFRSILYSIVFLTLISCQKETIDTRDGMETIDSKSTDLKFGFTTEKKTLKAKKTDTDKSLLARYNHRSLKFDDKMWIMGGILINGGKDDEYTYNSDDVQTTSNDILFSDDGKHWKNSTEKGDFPKRSLFGTTVFKKRIWVAGGLGESGLMPTEIINNDVWSSENGVQWKLVTPKAQFPKRFENTLTEFNGSLWLIGGVGFNEKAGSYETLSDVWNSSDGLNWVKAIENAPFGPRRWHSTVVHNGKIWVIGGGHNSYQSDVWYSDNGYQWTQATDAAPFSARGLHRVVSDGKLMWLTAGNLPGTSGHQNDIWYSSNGADWYEAQTSMEFPKRGQHSSVFYDGKLWVINGVGPSYGTGTSPIHSDVWSFGN